MALCGAGGPALVGQNPKHLPKNHQPHKNSDFSDHFLQIPVEISSVFPYFCRNQYSGPSPAINYTNLILDTGNFVLIGSILLFVSVMISRIGYRFGVPALVVFLAVGMLFGSDGVGIAFQNPQIAQFIGMVSLSIILFSGGMDTKFSEIRPVLGPGITLATAGVVIMMVVTGFAIYGLTLLFSGIVHLSIAECMLLAAVMSSTDSASVFSILRSKKKGLRYQLRPLLELESGSNDPMAYILTILLIETITWGGFSFWDGVWMFVVQMSLGALAGYLLARGVVFLINRIHLENHSLYSVLLLASVFFVFSLTDLVGGNGYLAVYIAGLVIGNSKMTYKRGLTTFFDGFTWLSQIVMFLTLGLLVNPNELMQVAWIGVLIAVIMIILARPLTVWLCMLPFKNFTNKARAYISWVGLRGAVPIIFATYPLVAGVEHATAFFNIVFCITLISLLVQGTTVGYFADLLGLSEEPQERGFDIDLPEKIKSALSEIEVVPRLIEQSHLLKDLPLPDNTLVVMVKHGDAYFVPESETELHEGDKLLVISDNDEQLRQAYNDLEIKPVGRK